MPRRRRFYEDNRVYHVINRGNKGARIFLDPWDYETFLDGMAYAAQLTTVKHTSFCLMSNHYHLVLQPEIGTDLSRYMQLLMNYQIARYQLRHGTRGTGHIYKGRFRDFPIEGEEHFLTVNRYVESNPVRAGLVNRAEDYSWSSLSRQATRTGIPLLSPWPVPKPDNWLELVNIPLGEEVLRPIRKAIERRWRRKHELRLIGELPEEEI